MNLCEKHPQRQEIIERLLKGDSTRKVAASVNPPLNQSTVSRFRMQILSPAVGALKGSRPNPDKIKELANAQGITTPISEGKEQFKDIIRHQVQNSVLTLEKDFRRWLGDAETSQSIDEVTGEVRHNMDHAALARHARNALSAIELRAKLNGVLQDAAGSTQVNVNAVVVMPSHAPESRDDGPVIDIDVVR